MNAGPDPSVSGTCCGLNCLVRGQPTAHVQGSKDGYGRVEGEPRVDSSQHWQQR